VDVTGFAAGYKSLGSDYVRWVTLHCLGRLSFAVNPISNNVMDLHRLSARCNDHSHGFGTELS
jgi:hypothetical protein